MSYEVSPYTTRPIEERAYDPLHATVKELIDMHSDTREVLDLGCSDGVATWGMPDLDVLGVDFDQSLLALAKEHNPDYRSVCADITNLPLTPDQLKTTDTVLMLDVLEHVERDEAIAVLNGLHRILPAEHTLIATIPICSPLSMETWREGIGVLRRRQRPETGIFDKTHRVFTGRRGHHDLLAEGGYTVTDEYQTNHIEGVTGDWVWKDELEGSYLIDLLRKRRQQTSPMALRAARLLTSAYTSVTTHGTRRMRQLGENFFAYQGLYVAKPSQDATFNRSRV